MAVDCGVRSSAYPVQLRGIARSLVLLLQLLLVCYSNSRLRGSSTLQPTVHYLRTYHTVMWDCGVETVNLHAGSTGIAAS